MWRHCARGTTDAYHHGRRMYLAFPAAWPWLSYLSIYPYLSLLVFFLFYLFFFIIIFVIDLFIICFYIFLPGTGASDTSNDTWNTWALGTCIWPIFVTWHVLQLMTFLATLISHSLWHLSLTWDTDDTDEMTVTLALIWQSPKICLMPVLIWHLSVTRILTRNASDTHLILRVFKQHDSDDVHVDSVAKTGVAVYTGHLYREIKK